MRVRPIDAPASNPIGAGPVRQSGESSGAFNFGGFNADDSTQFKVDFGLAGGGNADFRNILNGSTLEISFADGTTLTKPLSDFNSQTATYNFSGSDRAATPAVPEPATWAMMILGFGAIGVSLRSTPRRQAALAAT